MGGGEEAKGSLGAAHDDPTTQGAGEPAGQTASEASSGGKKEESKAEASQHDRAYRAMFEGVEMFEALLTEYAPEGWVQELDFEKAHQLQGKFGLPDFEQRESDMLWRIPRRSSEAGAYVVVMLEFQSSNDRWMAVRLMMYTALLWQRAVSEEGLGARDRLPPVFGVVMYRGEPRWTAPLSLSELIDLPSTHPLWAWQPQLRYHLIDERKEVARRSPEEQGLAGLLLRLEHDPDPGRFERALARMVDLFRGRSNLDTLKRVFARLQQSAAAKGRDVDDLILSLQQEKPMLDLIQQNFERVLDKLHAQGKEEGKLEGKLEGIREGIREGKLEGKLEGKREGKLEGEAVARAAQRRALVKYLNRCFGAEHGWEPLVGLVEDLDALQSLFDQADEAKTPQEMRDKIEAAALR